MTKTSITCSRVSRTDITSTFIISYMIFGLLVVNQIHSRSLSFNFRFVTALSSASSSSSRMVASVASSSTTGTTGKAKSKIIFHWFRNGDLRLHDNPALTHSVKLATTPTTNTATTPTILLPIYCFDDTKLFGTNCLTPNDDLKCSPKRAKFMIECVTDLQSNLQKECNAQLLIGKGDPATVFTNIIEMLGPKEYEYTIVVQDEVCKEEKTVAKSVMTAIKSLSGKVNFQSIWGSTMYELKDLPYDIQNNINDLPDVFTPFRTKVEKVCKIPRPLTIPTKSEMSSKIQSIKGTSTYTTIESIFTKYSTIPTLTDLGYTVEQVEYATNYDKRGVMEFIGGESAGLQRIKDYIWTYDCIKEYFDTRNGMIGPNYSTKFAPWLASGCISSRYIVAEIQKYEKQRIENKSTYWVIFELLWRDYCKFFAVKHGDSIFYSGGTIGKNNDWKYYDKSIIAWKTGTTGYPLVDANMRELASTGFMSNRGRQNVASFLAIDLNQDWRIGGDHFESLLLDYDVYSNWVNWCSAAGMTGGRLNRFNIVKQGKDYDQNGDYVRLWVPELKDVPKQYIHEPWKMSMAEQNEYNVKLGIDYPNPIVPPSSGGGGGGGGYEKNNNKSGNSSTNRNSGPNKSKQQGKQRKPNPNKSNSGQKYEMKSLKTGNYNME